MKVDPIVLNHTSLGEMFLAAAARRDQCADVAYAAWELLFDGFEKLPDHELPALVVHLLERRAIASRGETA
jgi:hypothetical protein